MAESTTPKNATPTAEDKGDEKAGVPAVLAGPLAGADALFDGLTHVGVAVEVAASGKVSYVVIPDAARIPEGQPIYITRPVTIKGQNLGTFFTNKNVTIPDPLNRLIKNTSISCDAFYYAPKKRAPTDAEKNDANVKKDAEGKIDETTLLLMFELDFNKGLIGTLAGDADLGALFDITGAKLRVLRCPASSRAALEQYAQQLSEE